MEVFSKAYLEEVIENQGKLFEYAQDHCPGMDIVDFINQYMNSRTRFLIDEGQAYVSTMDAESLFDYFLKNDQNKVNQAFQNVEKAFSGSAEAAGFHIESEPQDHVKKIRQEKEKK